MELDVQGAPHIICDRKVRRKLILFPLKAVALYKAIDVNLKNVVQELPKPVI